MKNSSFILIILMLVFCSVGAAQEEDKPLVSKHSLVVTGEYLSTIEFAHSKTTFDYMMGTISYQGMINNWWGYRLGVRPLFYAMSNVDERESLYGMGFSLGTIAYYDMNTDVLPYAEFNAGGVYFDEEVPVFGATKYNFTLSIGIGVEVPVADRSALILGYRFGHISNSNTGDRNPGINGNMIVAGFRYGF